MKRSHGPFPYLVGLAMFSHYFCLLKPLQASFLQGLFHDVCQVQRHSSNEDFKIWVPSGGHVSAPPGCVGPAPPPASSTWAILKLEKNIFIEEIWI